MISNRPYLYRSIIIIIFISINLLIIYYISHSLKYFNTEADRTQLFNEKIKVAKQYNPKQIWAYSNNTDTILTAKLKSDYITFWYRKSLSERYNNPVLSQDNFTEHTFKNYEKIVATHKDEKLHIESTTLTHHPTIEFFSQDGHFAVIKDSAVEYLQKFYLKNKLIAKEKTSNNYEFIMILEDGFWKVRQLKLLSKIKYTSQQKPRNTTFSIQNNNLLHKGKPFIIKGMNYYPKNFAWQNFWGEYPKKEIEKDLQLLSKSGLNTVRVFLPYEELGKDNVSKDMLANFKLFLSQCKANNIYVIPTLFDFFGNYDISNWTLTDRHLEQIVSRFKENTAILAWDIKNEPDLDFQHTSKQKVTEWLDFTIDKLKQYDPNHLITIGWSNAEDAIVLQNKLDFISFHYYQKPHQFKEIYSQLDQKSTTKLKVITEFGTHSFNSFYYPFAKNEIQQENYYNEIFKAYSQANLKHFMSWTLYDFEEVPDKVVGFFPWRKSLQENYGFIDKNGNKKLNFKHISGDFTNKNRTSFLDSINQFVKFTILLGLILLICIFLFFKKKIYYPLLKFLINIRFLIKSP